MQRVLDWFFHGRKFVMDCITFVSIRLYGIECTFEDVKKRAYTQNQYVNLNLDEAKDTDTLLTSAKDRYKEAIDRRAFVTDKAKTLITLNSALLAILAAFLPKATEVDSWRITLPFYGGVLLLLNALVTMWMYFDIKGETVIDLLQEEIGLDKENLKKSLINSYLRCQVDTNNITDFLADLYKTARFYFLFGFIVIFVILSINFFTRPHSSTSATKVIQELRGNPELIDLLRGPKGEKGEWGPKGNVGPQGPKSEEGEGGPQGEKGDKREPASKKPTRSSP